MCRFSRQRPSMVFGIVRLGIGYEIEAAWEHVREDLVMHL